MKRQSLQSTLRYASGKTLACFIALAAACVGAQSSAPIWTELKSKDDTGTMADAIKLNRLFTGLAESLSPAVVNIYTKTRVPSYRGGNANDPNAELFRFFFGNPFMTPDQGRGGRSQEAQSLGSGFVINGDGIIVTNSHVIRQSGRNADAILVKFINDSPNHPGHEATVVGVDELTDVAVLKIKEKVKGLKVAPLGNSDQVKVGEWVMAIGNPYGHTHSVTSGIVSAMGRSLEQTRTDFIQTDASINPGNSGGPLFNAYGEVIGINTAIDARAQGIGFAIPVNTAKGVIRQLVEKGEVTLGWIGVVIADLTPELAESLGLELDGGALLQDTIPGEPADKAGLKSYDVITQVNGKNVRSQREFSIAVGNLAPGAKAALKIWRDGKARDVVVTVAKRKSQEELAKADQARDLKTAQETKGMLFADLNGPVRAELQLPPEVQGVLVSDVLRGSPAAQAGITPGDVIVEVNRKPVKDSRAARAALGAKADSFLLKVQRRSATLIVLMNVGR
jgi:serine protease Do